MNIPNRGLIDTDLVLKAWTHPTTNQKRIYVNNHPFEADLKIYLIKGEDGEAVVKSSTTKSFYYPAFKNALRQLGCSRMFEAVEAAVEGLDLTSFDDLLSHRACKQRAKQLHTYQKSASKSSSKNSIKSRGTDVKPQ